MPGDDAGMEMQVMPESAVTQHLGGTPDGRCDSGSLRLAVVHLPACVLLHPMGAGSVNGSMMEGEEETSVTESAYSCSQQLTHISVTSTQDITTHCAQALSD